MYVQVCIKVQKCGKKTKKKHFFSLKSYNLFKICALCFYMHTDSYIYIKFLDFLFEENRSFTPIQRSLLTKRQKNTR